MDFKTVRLDPLMVAVERHPPRLPLSQSTETEELMKLNDNNYHLLVEDKHSKFYIAHLLQGGL